MELQKLKLSVPKILGSPSAPKVFQNNSSVIDKLEQANLVLVPQLYFSETANALWKYVSHNQLSAEQAIERYQDVCALPDQAISDQTLALEALSLACINNHPVYDMIYAVLARRNACGVLSRDNRLAGLLESLGVPAAP